MINVNKEYLFPFMNNPNFAAGRILYTSKKSLNFHIMKKLLYLLCLSSLFFFSEQIQAQTCSSPTGLNASPVYDFQVTLNWNAVAGAQFYNIRYRKVGTVPFTTTSSTPNQKVISGLVAGTNYEFQVQTKCVVGTSTYSALSSFTTDTTCFVPTNLGTAGVFPFYAFITWDTVDQAIFYTTRYKKRDVAGPFQTGTNNTNTKGLGPLAQGTWYIFQASSNCPGGQSAYSYIDSFLTPCGYPEPYNTPGVYTDTMLQTEVDTITYSDDAFCKHIASLVDTLGGNNMGSTVCTQTVSTSVNTSQDPSFTYGRRMTNVNPSSNGHGTLILTFSQDDFNDYNANNGGFVDLPNFGDSNHVDIPNMRIAKWDGAAKTYITPDSMRWNGTTNFWIVYLRQNSIKGDYYFFTGTDCSSVTVAGLNTTQVLGSSFRANWTQLTNPVFGWYSLRYKPVASGTWKDGGTSAYTTNSKLLIGLTPNTPYEVQIRFHCSSLVPAGPWSSSATFTTLNTCWAPSSVSAVNITASSAKVTWPAAPGALYYTMRHRKTAGPGPWVTGTTNSTNKNITGLTAATQYDVQVGTNCAGWLSPLTPIYQFTTNASRPGSTIEAAEEVLTSLLGVYPNPTTDNLTVQFTDSKEAGYELSVLDMQGKVLYTAHAQTSIGTNEYGVNVSAFPTGMYLIRMVGSGEVHQVKFIKE
jgi:hypothetical protein